MWLICSPVPRLFARAWRVVLGGVSPGFGSFRRRSCDWFLLRHPVWSPVPSGGKRSQNVWRSLYPPDHTWLIKKNIYRPPTKLREGMFSVVCLSVHGVEVPCGRYLWRTEPHHTETPRRQTQLQIWTSSNMLFTVQGTPSKTCSNLFGACTVRSGWLASRRRNYTLITQSGTVWSEERAYSYLDQSLLNSCLLIGSINRCSVSCRSFFVSIPLPLLSMVLKAC